MIRPKKQDNEKTVIRIKGEEHYCRWNFSMPVCVLWFGNHKKAWGKFKEAILKAIKNYEKENL